MGGRESQRLIVALKRGNEPSWTPWSEGVPRRGEGLEPCRGHRASKACPRQTAWPCEGQRSHDVTNRVREIRTPGSVGALGGNPQSDPARLLPRRVGKGRPAGSIELRVSPSPSKIPYGGFSPVRLQMDRQWRPSTTSRGLSAVHIRPMTPSYTPPQFSLPGIRDPRRGLPVLEPFGSIWHDSQQLQHVHPEALGSPSGYSVPTAQTLTMASSEALGFSRRLMVSLSLAGSLPLRPKPRDSPI